MTTLLQLTHILKSNYQVFPSEKMTSTDPRA